MIFFLFVKFAFYFYDWKKIVNIYFYYVLIWRRKEEKRRRKKRMGLFIENVLSYLKFESNLLRNLDLYNYFIYILEGIRF